MDAFAASLQRASRDNPTSASRAFAASLQMRPTKYLDAQVLVCHVVGQFTDRATHHTPALLENPELASDAPGERKLLLDEQHGDALLLVERQQDVSDFVDHVRLNAFGRLVEDQQL